jgi:hypothetical protein
MPHDLAGAPTQLYSIITQKTQNTHFRTIKTSHLILKKRFEIIFLVLKATDGTGSVK